MSSARRSSRPPPRTNVSKARPSGLGRPWLFVRPSRSSGYSRHRTSLAFGSLRRRPVRSARRRPGLEYLSRPDADAEPAISSFLESEVGPGSASRRRETAVRFQEHSKRATVFTGGLFEDDWLALNWEQSLESLPENAHLFLEGRLLFACGCDLTRREPATPRGEQPQSLQRAVTGHVALAHVRESGFLKTEFPPRSSGCDGEGVVADLDHQIVPGDMLRQRDAAQRLCDFSGARSRGKASSM